MYDYTDPNRSAVNQYVTDIFGMNNGKGVAPATSSVTSIYGGQGNNGINLGIGNDWLQSLGGMTDIATGLFGLYSASQGLDMSRTNINNQAIAYNNNARNQQNFTNGVIDAFGSSQQKTNNQMASFV